MDVSKSSFKWSFAIIFFPVGPTFYAVKLANVPVMELLANEPTFDRALRLQQNQGKIRLKEQHARWFLYARVIDGYTTDEANGIATNLTNIIR